MSPQVNMTMENDSTVASRALRLARSVSSQSRMQQGLELMTIRVLKDLQGRRCPTLTWALHQLDLSPSLKAVTLMLPQGNMTMESDSTVALRASKLDCRVSSPSKIQQAQALMILRVLRDLRSKRCPTLTWDLHQLDLSPSRWAMT